MKIIATGDISNDATKIKECVDNLNKDINELKNYIDAIPQIWVGDDATRIIKKYNDEFFPELKKYKQVLDDYYVFLTKVYEIFRTLDENYNKSISID